MILGSCYCIEFVSPLGLHTRKSFYFWIFHIFNRYSFLLLVH